MKDGRKDRERETRLGPNGKMHPVCQPLPLQSQLSNKPSFSVHLFVVAIRNSIESKKESFKGKLKRAGRYTWGNNRDCMFCQGISSWSDVSLWE